MLSALPSPFTPWQRPRRSLSSLALLCAAVFGHACDDTTGPTLVPEPSFVILSGNAQTGQAGAELPQPIVAKATNSAGALPGITVSFVVTNGGGRLYAGTGVTDSNGEVRDYWTLGAVAGQTQRVQVRAVDPTTGVKNVYATFSATAVPGPPAIIKVNAGDGQIAFTRSVLPIRPSVLVTDALGNRIGGVSVTFAPISGGSGSVSGGAGITGTNGVATVGAWRLGRGPGMHRLIATSSGLTGSPLTFNATAKFGLRAVATGMNNSCGLSAANDVYCWGENSTSQLGDGSVSDRSAPVRLGSNLLLASLAFGDYHTCGLTSTGEAYCWGSNGDGQLGIGPNPSSSTPVAVSGTETFEQIDGGSQTTCGVVLDGTVWCWGLNGNGQFGDGTTTGSDVPVVAAGGQKFQSIYRGYLHTCGLESDGDAFCWGFNGYGQLGDGTTTNRLVPTALTGLKFTSLELGAYHTCGLGTDGAARCWGRNGNGQVGTGFANPTFPSPMFVAGGIPFTQIAAGFDHTCGITASGTAYCWGDNGQGELGIGAVGGVMFQPTRVAGGRAFSTIKSGNSHHTCAVPVEGGSPFCWGYNAYGQIGDGTNASSQVPIEVLPPPIP